MKIEKVLLGMGSFLLLFLSYIPQVVGLTIGNELISGQVDSSIGNIFAMTDHQFEETGYVTDWSFYTARTTAYTNKSGVYIDEFYVTPLLLNYSNNEFSISGIGATVTVAVGTIGVISSDFNLLYGSDQVSDGMYFGWWNGDLDTHQVTKGSVAFNGTSVGSIVYSTGFDVIYEGLSFTPVTGSSYPTGTLNRTYSYQVTDPPIAPVPEPATFLLLGTGILCLGLLRKRPTGIA